MYFRALHLTLFFSLTLCLQAQQDQKPSLPIDSTSLRSALMRGKLEARFRLYMMSTDNTDHLTDYGALAFGGGLRYESGAWHGLSFGVSGFFILNLVSTDLSTKDPTTGAKNRYEIGQFDVEDPTNRNDMDRLEDFFLKYKMK